MDAGLSDAASTGGVKVQSADGSSRPRLQRWDGEAFVTGLRLRAARPLQR